MLNSPICQRLLKFKPVLPRMSKERIITCACQKTNTLYFERETQAPKKLEVWPPEQKRDHLIYKVVGRDKGPSELKVILTEDSLEYGVTGEVLTLDKIQGREMIRRGVAVYASPENLEELANSLVSKSQQTMTGRRLLLWLRMRDVLRCPMRPDTSWVMTPAVAARGLQRAHNLIVPENALELPDYPITSEDSSSWSEHEIKITVNNVDTLTVKMEIVPWNIINKKS